ncbi:hypothetical protein D3C75_1322360 [compost metagenome]
MLADPCVVVPVSRYDQQPVHTGKGCIKCLRLAEITVTDINSACTKIVRFLRVSNADDQVFWCY